MLPTDPEGVKKQDLQVSSLAEHAEVCGESKIGEKYMEDATPHQILWQNVSIEENQIVPEKPWDVAADERYKQVHMHRDSTTVKGAAEDKNEKRNDEENDRDRKTHKHEGVDEVSKRQIFKVKTVCIVWPSLVW